MNRLRKEEQDRINDMQREIEAGNVIGGGISIAKNLDKLLQVTVRLVWSGNVCVRIPIRR